jgi:hypothetical protein
MPGIDWLNLDAAVALPCGAALYAAPPAPQPLSDEQIEIACGAIRKAFQLGQTYWQQADSESYKQNAKADATRDRYLTLLDDTRAVLAAAQEQQQP